MNWTNSDVNNLLQILPHTKKDAIHAVEVARRLNLPTSGNQVIVRGLIRYAIKTNLIMGSTRVGYWLSTNKLEVEEYISSLEKRANSTLQRSQDLKKLWNNKYPNNKI